MMRKNSLYGMLLLGGALLLPGMLSAQKKDAVPKEWGHKLPWQNWANVVTLPAMQNVEALTDGNLKTSVRMTMGGEAGSEYTFKFPKAVDVTMFRFAQIKNGVSKYKLMADIEGKGDYSVQIALREDPKPVKGEFIDIPVNRNVFGLKLVAISGEIGYRSLFPFLSEVEIYTKEAVRANLPQVYGPMVQNSSYKQIPPFKKRNIDIRICTDQWNYGMGSWKPEKSSLSEHPGYRNLVNSLQELDANSVRFFDETMCGEKGKLPFPSKLVESEYTVDWMKPLTDALAKDGYKLYYFTHAWKPPFQERGNMAPMPWCRWDYPYHQSDTVFGLNSNYKRAYPCVLCKDDYRVKWTQMMREALQNGASGVYVMPDEWFFKGHNLARANCPECTAEFKKMFGYDSMPKPETDLKADAGGYISAPPSMDSDQYRKWKMFEYIKMSELFKKVSADLRKEFPNAQLINNDNQAITDISSGRLEHTIASDIIGTDPNVNFAQVYGSGSVVAREGDHISFIKRFEASAGKDKLLSAAGWGNADLSKPMATYGGILSEVMLGAKIVEVYRHNYMYMSNGVSVYKKLFRMIRLLEEWNIDKAQVPELACMLFPRASEDWYYTKVSAMMSPDKKGDTVDFYLHLADESINKRVNSEGGDDLQRFLAQDRVRGFGARQTMESLLSVNGVPYKVAYTERPDNMKNLKRFKLLLMPFSYSLSKEAFAEVKSAVESGTKLIIFEQLAPTDEYGNKYEKPLLEELIGKPGVTFIKESLADTSADTLKMREYKKLINDALKTDGYSFENNGNPVSYVVTALPEDSGYILYLGNHMPYGEQVWGSGKTARVTIGLPGSGDYKMETYSSDSNELNINKINGKDIISADLLKKFTVEIAPQEVKLIRIYR